MLPRVHPISMLGAILLLSLLNPRSGDAAEIYGVRWRIIVNEETDYSLPCERLEKAVGMKADDFDTVFPWSAIKRQEIGGNVMVEIPKHYTRRDVRDGYEYRMISAEKLPGFYVDPAFVENGKEVEKIYVGAYEARLDDTGRMVSKAGVHPTADKTRVEYREAAKANGKGFGIFDLRTLLMLQNLFLVEHADRNSQKVIGNGWAKMLQPARTHRSVREEMGVNRLITRPGSITNESALMNGLFVGCAITITSDAKPGNVYFAGRILTKVELHTPEPDLVTFTFDGAPVNTTTDMCLGGAAQMTGLSDAIEGHSGHGSYHGSPPHDVYRSAVKYRHIENLWGNLWCFIDGANLSNGKLSICNNMSDYASGVTNGAYHSAGIPQLMQNDNGDIGGPREIHFLKNLGFDPQMPWLAVPQDFTHVGKDAVPDQSAKLRDANFGDYYYLNDKATCYVHGGGFDHYWRCGLFTLRGWSSDTQHWYLYGSRLIYKPLN